jgi:hypothetical protein
MVGRLKSPFPFLVIILVLGSGATTHAQDSTSAKAMAPPRSPSRLGLDLFGGAGVSWPDAKDSFEAVDLSANPLEFGGGARLGGLWGGMFLQFSGAHWSDSGDRVFIDSDGTIFRLGIPLSVDATFIDGTIGLKRALNEGPAPYLFYLGGGAGVVRYSEKSPFAEDRQDLELTELSYHALAGIEIPVHQRLAAFVETKYRYVPHLLGDEGASAIFGEDSFGGFNATVGLRIGFGPSSSVQRPGTAGPPEISSPSAPSKPSSPVNVPPDKQQSAEAAFAATAPVYLLPDATRTPLTTLKAGTRVRILDRDANWLQIEFNDQQFGRRVGWVEARFVRLPNK